MTVVEAVRWSADGTAVDIIDQRCLPGELVRRELRTVDGVCDAIATLAVRGASAIGIAGRIGSVRPTAALAALVSAIITDRGIVRHPYTFVADGHLATGEG